MNPKYIIYIGIIVVIIGIVLYFFPNAFKWFGNLPGDFKGGKGNVRFYFPMMSMIIISIVISLILRFFRN